MQDTKTQLITINSKYTFNETISQLKSALQNKGFVIFATIDHAKAAKDVELSMPATQVIIFGKPEIGTKLMLQAPDLAIQLPLRVLVSQREDTVQVGVLEAGALASSVGAPTSLTEGLNKVSVLLTNVLSAGEQ